MIARRLVPYLLLAALVVGACSDREPPLGTPSPDPGSPTPASGTVTGTTTQAPTASPIPGYPASYDNARALEHIRVLAVDIGPRVAGSQAEQEAVEYIRTQLEGNGYAVDVQQFSYTGNRFPLSTVVAGEVEVEAYALQGSGGGRAEGRAVYVGIGDDAAIAGQDLAGAVAVAERGVIPFRTKYLNVREAGAIALVTINDEPGALTNGKLDAAGAFPVVGVSQEDGEPVRIAARAGLTLAVEALTGDDGEALNVLARTAEGASCDILVGGHHDTVPGAPGATDNASGVAHVLELARAMAADGLDEGLCFATFGAEESGLYGSKELVSRLNEDGDMPVVMLNLDVTGTGSDVEAIGTPARVDQVVQIAMGLNIPVRATTLPPNTGSDHSSFEEAGAEVIFLSSGDYSSIHTPLDTFEGIQPEDLDQVGQVALTVLKALYREVARG